jgi:hypothetical protein
MIVDLSFTSFLAYVIGPILGGVLAALFYDRFVRTASAATDGGNEEPSRATSSTR